MWSNIYDKSQNTETHGETPNRSQNVVSTQKAMKDAVQAETLINWDEKVKELTFQGDFVNLLIEEEENVTWKSICNNMPK